MADGRALGRALLTRSCTWCASLSLSQVSLPSPLVMERDEDDAFAVLDIGRDDSLTLVYRWGSAANMGPGSDERRVRL